MILANHVVRLEPLGPEHVPGLLAAATQDRSAYAFTHVPADEQEVRDYVRAALETVDRVPYAVRRLDDGSVAGSTSFLAVETWPLPGETERSAPSVCEIGSTWYAASAQRTAVNTACKLLMLTQAFEAWGVARVSLQTDARNQRSRAAIERIGGRFEGVRRAHKLGSDGTLRDSAQFSITVAEWPDVRTRLRRGLSPS